jgi:hypothetical protein
MVAITTGGTLKIGSWRCVTGKYPRLAEIGGWGRPGKQQKRAAKARQKTKGRAFALPFAPICEAVRVDADDGGFATRFRTASRRRKYSADDDLSLASLYFAPQPYAARYGAPTSTLC